MTITNEEEYWQAVAKANAIVDNGEVEDPWEVTEFNELVDAMTEWEDSHPTNFLE
jgi:hypothetical protein